MGEGSSPDPGREGMSPDLRAFRSVGEQKENLMRTEQTQNRIRDDRCYCEGSLLGLSGLCVLSGRGVLLAVPGYI